VRSVLRALSIGAAATFVAAVAHATSIVPPENLGELARSSEAVVLAIAGTSQTVQRGPLLFTVTGFRVRERVAGPLEARERITVEAPGGELDGLEWLVPGSPRFEPGQMYLLFLDQKPTGEWLPRMMAYGILRRVTGRDGSTLLAPLPEQTDIQPFLREDGILPEAVETYVEGALLPHLREVAIGRQRWNARAVTARSAQVPMEVYAMAPPSGCSFMQSGGNNARWQVFNSYTTIYADSDGDPSITDGGFTQVSAAITDWNGIPSTTLSLVQYGGPMNFTLTCTSDPQDHPGYGTNIVVFNDPCSDIADLSGCSGTLGYGGPWMSGTHSFDGTTWATIVGWFVVLNNGVGCLGSTGYKLMVEHELGHGLGFGHVSDSSALMYSMCCHAINTTDTTCAQYTYPSGAPVPTSTPTRTPTRTPTPSGPTPTPSRTPTPGGPTPTRTPTPIGPTPTRTPTPLGPPAPTGVSASDGTYTDRVRITWNASAGATGYWIYRNTTATPPATEIGGSFSTAYDDSTAVAGQTYFYWVRAGNLAGWSTYSASDTGYRAIGPAPTPTRTPTPAAGLTPAFTFLPTAPLAGKAVQFTDASNGATSWQWTFGDGQTSTVRNPLHTYSVRGRYTVILRITGASGSAQTSHQITVGARARRNFSD
jgi:hypothetical protein